MYKLKISGYLLMLLLSVPNVVSAGRTGYIAPNPFLDVGQVIGTAILLLVMLKCLLKSLNPKEDLDLRGRITLFILSIAFSLFSLFLMSASLNALGIINTHLF